MLPLALSAVMVGLGVLIGLLRTEPDLLTRWWIPAFGHIMLTTPFVVRILLPAIRRLDPDLESASALLGAGPLRRLFSIRLPLLRGSLIVAASFVLAISLGEFGASWVVVRFGEWSTLPVLIGERLARPGWNPLMRPAAYASSTALLFVTMALFMAVERFRPDGARGDF
jgi:thiamine transport system permease protein